MRDRIELFVRLSSLAFATEHPYWGWRFLAWSLHYLQDLTQPYHAKAVPHERLGYYLSFALSSAETQARVKKETSQLVKNRHFALEDFAGEVVLNEGSFAEFGTLVAELRREDSWERGNPEVQARLEEIATASDRVSLPLDLAVTVAFGPRICGDPSYDLESDRSYRIQTALGRMSQDVRRALVVALGERFREVGRVTRSWIAHARTDGTLPTPARRGK
jgi:hypothetical protein